MAYNSVGTPKFLIDHSLLYQSLGNDFLSDITGITEGEALALLQLNPANRVSYDTGFSFLITQHIPINYVAYLGHEGGNINAYWTYEDASENQVYPNVLASGEGLYMNWEINLQNDVPLSGFSIVEVFPVDGPYIKADVIPVTDSVSQDIGAISIGSTYTLPHSADLSLSISYETGTKTIETKGGASLSNTNWRPPLWGDLAAWELSDPANPTTGQALAHGSRRTWSLSFSFLSKEDTFPKYNALNRYSNEELSDPEVTADETLLDSDDFYSQVWNRVGNNRFIFQPDKDVNEFAICRFDQKSLSLQQTAPGLYSCKLKVVEAW